MKEVFIKQVKELTPEEALELVKQMRHWGAYQFSYWKMNQEDDEDV